uniref:Transcriptional regulator n=1 Tax=Haemonchus placei TaxID=6290 RepID=A0A0N4WWY0_HAEPC
LLWSEQLWCGLWRIDLIHRFACSPDGRRTVCDSTLSLANLPMIVMKGELRKTHR